MRSALTSALLYQAAVPAGTRETRLLADAQAVDSLEFMF
jgi:hypothetical protein